MFRSVFKRIASNGHYDLSPLLRKPLSMNSVLCSSRATCRVAPPPWRCRRGQRWRLHSGGKFSPRGPMGEYRPRMDLMADFFDRWENEVFGGMESLFPTVTREGMRVAMDVKEDNERYAITADLPGMTKQDVKIQVTPERVLTISGERKTESSEDKGGYYRSERRFGRFFRSFRLPQNADEGKITAKANEGVLEISIPKTQKDTSTARVIDIE